MLKTPRRVRILFFGACLADTIDTSGALLVWEHDYYPQLYLPNKAFVKPTGFDVVTSERGEIKDNQDRKVATKLEIQVQRTEGSSTDSASISDSIIRFADDLEGPAKDLRSYVKIQFNAVGMYMLVEILAYYC